ncbi:MAG: curli assembly protein CsgF [Maricaulaceae bacterium]
MHNRFQPTASGLTLAGLALGLATVSAAPATAQSFVYQPVNPSFGGNPFNSSHLIGLAQIQNDFEPPLDPASGLSDADRFVRSLESRLLSSLSRDVTEAIFGENAAEFGRVVFGDQIIEFEQGLESLRLTIFDQSTGTSTEIEVPTLITD